VRGKNVGGTRAAIQVGRDVFGWPLLLADNYNRATTGHHRRHRAHRGRTETFLAEVSEPFPACRSLRAAGQPRPAVHRPCRILASDPGAFLGQPPVGRAVRAASSSSGRVLVRALAWARVPAWACRLGGRESEWQEGSPNSVD
jgi:hypothetical protein